VTDAPRRVVSVALLAEPEAVGSASRTLATYRQWDIDPDRLLQRLRTRSSVCVPTARREQLLAVEGANARLAADKHAACEYLHRAPKR